MSPVLEAEYTLKYGDIWVALTESEYLGLQDNEAGQRALIEHEAGVPFSVVREHVQLGGCLQCAATTKQGNRCKRFVVGHPMSLKEWVRRQGEFCSTHLDYTMNIGPIGGRDA